MCVTHLHICMSTYMSSHTCVIPTAYESPHVRTSHVPRLNATRVMSRIWILTHTNESESSHRCDIWVIHEWIWLFYCVNEWVILEYESLHICVNDTYIYVTYVWFINEYDSLTVCMNALNESRVMSRMWTSHVTPHMWVMSHILMSHEKGESWEKLTHESCRTCSFVSHVAHSRSWVMSHILMSHEKGESWEKMTRESCRTYSFVSHVAHIRSWVMSHIFRSWVMSHIFVRESCRTYSFVSHEKRRVMKKMTRKRWVMKKVTHESCRMDLRVMERVSHGKGESWEMVSHDIFVSHISWITFFVPPHTCGWVVAHTWMRHVTRMNASCHTYECPKDMNRLHINLMSCHTCEWVMSHMWMGHVVHTNEPSWHTYECPKDTHEIAM